MAIDLKRVVERVHNEMSRNPEAVVELSMYHPCDDAVEEIERIVARNNGDFKGVRFSGGPTWDMRRLAVATDPKYIDRCRNHPYFQDLLGQAYGGRIFE